MHFPQHRQVSNKVSQEAKTKLSMTNDNNGLTNLNNNGTSKQTQTILRQYQFAQFCQQIEDLSDLDSAEISMNFHTLIDDSQFGEGLFSDIFQNHGKNIESLPARHISDLYGHNTFSRTLTYLPQPVHGAAEHSPSQNSPNSDSDSSYGSDVHSIKEEPLDPECMSNISNTNISAFSGAVGAFSTVNSNNLQQQYCSVRNQKIGKNCDKGSEEYLKKRIRNNIAVRKSREKANKRKREIEEKNKDLLRDNERLKKQLEAITEELNLLKSLVNHFGASPQQLSRELGKQLDFFQLQQQQMHL